MPRCNCEGGRCSCLVLPGAGIDVTGSGSASNPYVVTATQDLTSRISVADTPSVDMHADGSGTTDDPLVISADVTMDLDDLGDVEAETPTAGDTLVWNGTTWVSAPPAVVPPGTVNVGAGLTGTGSVTAPVAAAVSGVWGVSPLDVYGGDSTSGLAIYVDSNGQLRGEPRVPTISYDDLVDVPATFPTTWDAVAGKPTSWPTTESTSFFSPVSGWSIRWQRAHRTGSVCTVSLGLRREAAPVQAPESGNIANISLGTVSAALRPRHYAPLSTTTAGPLMSAYVDATGVVRLTAIAPNYRIATGYGIGLAGTWVCSGG